MSKIYPLEWLDALILQTFDPHKTNVSAISEIDLSFISENIQKESQKIQIKLKNEVFSMNKRRQIRLLVRKYHSTFIFLLDNVIENQKDKIFESPNLSKIMDMIIGCLDELLCFIEIRFSSYLSLDERVPITYAIVSRKELQMKLEKVKKKKELSNTDKDKMEIVVAGLSKSNEINRSYKITYRQISYQRALLRNLEEFHSIAENKNIFTTLDRMLIEINFNSLEYINYLTNSIANYLNESRDPMCKLNCLMLYYKNLNQLYCNEKVMFDPSQHTIKDSIGNWLVHELKYYNKTIDLTSDIMNNSDRTSSSKDCGETKIECALSIDQMGLILRAGDEARILKAKSMNEVFKKIVPYLSTTRKKDLSYNSMRSKSYTAEERDKEIAIETLEKMIRHIKGF